MNTPPPLEHDPYAPPSAPPVRIPVAGYPLGVAPGMYRRVGKLLAFRSGAELPAYCIATGEQALHGRDYRRQHLSWSPPWTLALLLLGLLPYLIVALVLRKSATVRYCLSAPERGKLLRRRLVGWGMVLTGLVLVIGIPATLDLSDDWFPPVILAGVVVLLTGLVLLSLWWNPIRVAKVQDDWFFVRGCSEKFLALLEPG